MLLNDLADIYVGKNLKRYSIENAGDDANKIGYTNYNVINPKAVDEGYLIDDNITNNLFKFSIDMIEKKENFVENGDILIKLSSPYEACLVNDEKYVGSTFPSFIAKIKIKEKINEYYLLAFLNSETAKKQISSFTTSNVVSLLNVKDLGQLNVPITDKEIELKIGKQYKSYLEKKALINRIIKLEKERNDFVFYQMSKKEVK